MGDPVRFVLCAGCPPLDQPDGDQVAPHAVLAPEAILWGHHDVILTYQNPRSSILTVLFTVHQIHFRLRHKDSDRQSKRRNIGLDSTYQSSVRIC